MLKHEEKILKTLKKFILIYPYNFIIFNEEDYKRYNLKGLKPLKKISKFLKASEL